MHEWFDWSPQLREQGRAEIRDAVSQCTEAMSAILDGSLYIGKSRTQEWKSEMSNGNEGPTIAVLIMLFLNLKSITICDTDSLPSYLVEIVANIVAASRKTPGSFHPLQKLTTVRLERSSTEFYAWFEVFQPFTELQSVRELSGKMFDGWDCAWSNEHRNKSDDGDDHEIEDAKYHRFENEMANGNDDDKESEDEIGDEFEYKSVESEGGITRIKFKQTIVNAESFKFVLRSTKALRDFEYSYDERNFTGDTKWEPATIIRSLLLYAGHSLVSFSLTGNAGSWDVCVDDSPYSAKSPRRFQVLRRLHVQEGLFVNSVTGETHRLVDILPPSLEKLKLSPSSFSRGHIRSVFSCFPELKESRLPLLGHITLAKGLELDENWKVACKEVGTDVVG